MILSSCRPCATLTVRRYADKDEDRFLISLAGFHYEGEGRIVDRSQLEEALGTGATEILITQLDADILEAELKQERAA
jgi:hypothetical protein